MARSSYIYVVHRHVGSLVLSAFTVKRELVEWMHQRPGLRGNTTVLRLRDGDMGQYNDGVDITPDIEEAAYEDQA